MVVYPKIFIRHLSISISLFAIFASLDMYLTLKGISGDTSLEGNPVMRYMMHHFGLLLGLIVGKAINILIALILAIVTFRGIDNRADWVYYLALTKSTRNWMARKKRYWVAFIPLYFIAISQGVAASSWVYLFIRYGSLN